MKSPSPFPSSGTEEAARTLQSGGVGVIPTDTLYGIVASVLNKDSVERVYTLKGRDMRKPCIVLLAEPADLEKFDIVFDAKLKAALARIWPAPVSVVLSCTSDQFAYLHRGTKSLAFRVPRDESLRAFLKETGHLIAPSANPEGLPPAKTIEEAKHYFADEVDFYNDGGILEGEPSTLVEYRDGRMTVLREGAMKIARQTV